MSEDNLRSRIRARKSRIRQRLNRHECERKPFRLTRRKVFEVAVGLSLLALSGAAAFRQSASNPVPECYHALPSR
jgi:hypothetical protein